MLKLRYCCFLVLLAVVSCTTDKYAHDRHFKMPEDIAGLGDKYNNYIECGEFDSLVIVTRPYFLRSIKNADTLAVQYTGSFIAQSFLCSENYDSAKKYLEILDSWMKESLDSKWGLIYYSTRGHFHLKYEANYAKALSYYLMAAEYASKGGLVNSQIAGYYNVVYIFYILSNRHGMEYALKALELSENENVRPFYKVAAYVSMSQMLYLSEEYGNAMAYLDKARTIYENDSLVYWTPEIWLLYGDLYRAAGDYGTAEKCYGKAMDFPDNIEAATMSLIYLNFGKLYEECGRLDDAMDMYNKGLEKSLSYKNLEFRREHIKCIAELLYVVGRKNMAADYYNKYVVLGDSVNMNNNEREFLGELHLYSERQRDYEILAKNLELSEEQRKFEFSVFIIVLIFLALVFMFFTYARQRYIYRNLVSQYEEYRKRISANKADKKNGIAESQNELFHKIEDVMRQGTFRQKDITLEKLAEIVASNRTDVSNTINAISGMNFYGYLNNYRIAEAVRVLSDIESREVPLKQLAEDIGYNSIQIFYKVFKNETGVTPGVYRKEVLKLGGKSTCTD